MQEIIAELAEHLAAPCSESDVESGIAVAAGPHGTAVVTLARPDKLNALSLASWERLADVFEALGADPAVRVAVVRGSGGAFGAGADIAEFPEVRMTGAAAVRYNETIAWALSAVAAVPVPVIAMVRGLAVGGGCELAAACDLRVSSENARYGIPIGRLGVTLGYVEAQALVRLIGSGQLKRILLEGELLDAAEAHRIHLVEYLVADESLETRTATLVARIVSSAAVTIRAAKLVADMCDRPLTARDTEHLVRATVEAYEGPDLKEGVAAFTERRRPEFTQGKVV